MAFVALMSDLLGGRGRKSAGEMSQQYPPEDDGKSAHVVFSDLFDDYNWSMEEKNVTQPTSQRSNSESELFDAFILLNAMLHSLSSMLSAETKLALSDLVANEHIRIHGSLTAKEVAHRVQMGSGATTALIDRLERKGYVKRTPHPTDRRSVIVESLAEETTSTPKLLEFLNRLQERIEELDPALRPGMTKFMHDVSEDITKVLKTS